VINGVDFTTVYEGNVLPTAATPAWSGVVTGSAVANSPSAGILTLSTLVSENAYFETPWSASTPTTLEFSMKVNSVDPAAFAATAIYFTNGGPKDYRIAFTSSAILVGDISGTPSNPSGTYATYAFDTTALTTYRITLEGGALSLYLNNSPTAAVSGYTGTGDYTGNAFIFGDASGNVGGTSEWQYVAFTNDGAFAPVPEPAAVGLFAMGAAIFLSRSRSRRELSV
jgi:hypothetical protein